MASVGFSYPGCSAEALAGIDLVCGPGEVIGILGPNGAGKSTLLRLAAGLVAPSRGEVRVLGEDPARSTRRRVARSLALVPASLHAGFPMTVRDFVSLGRTPHLRGLFESSGDRASVTRAMAFADVEALADRPYGTLSAGEQRRVLIARAVAQEPRVLLLDEPTANLDVAHAVSLLESVTLLARSSGAGVVAAIHDLNVALLFCDRIVLLKAGRIVAQGIPEDVMQFGTIREVFGGGLYIGRNELNGKLFLVPMALK
jgi:iron complex transport system ATP-binding protein